MFPFENFPEFRASMKWIDGPECPRKGSRVAVEDVNVHKEQAAGSENAPVQVSGADDERPGRMGEAVRTASGELNGGEELLRKRLSQGSAQSVGRLPRLKRQMPPGSEQQPQAIQFELQGTL